MRRVLQSLLWASLAVLLVLSPSLANSMPKDADQMIAAMEAGYEAEFRTYFGHDFGRATLSTEDIAQQLQQLQDQTGIHPAVIWMTSREEDINLTAITPDHQVVNRQVPEASRKQLDRAVRSFHRDLVTLRLGKRLTSAQRLHRWLIEPLEADLLQPEGIDTLLLCMSDGLRGVPIAALHDGDRFLIEKYNLTQIPAFSLVSPNLIQTPQAERKVLAMGVSEFPDKEPLPAVPLELSAIIEELELQSESDKALQDMRAAWQGRSFLNETSTLDALKQQLRSDNYNIVHLATHAAFEPGQPEQSALYLWDGQKLSLEQMNSLPWKDLDLLVLSACTTAVGDEDAELGFAGLALQAGANSAVASLWNVSDSGTLALMSEFYRQLSQTTTKAEALRNAQLRMLRGDVRLEDLAHRGEGTQLQLSRRTVNLPGNLLPSEDSDFSNPYYWAGFLMLSNP